MTDSDQGAGDEAQGETTMETQEPQQDLPQNSRVKARISSLWGLLASGAGVIATIGGVIGVYQFLKPPEPASTNTA